MERLAIQIQRLVDEGSWHPIRITKEGIGISHFFFADDVMLFCQASKGQMKLISNTLKDFCNVSGMKVNLEKSRMCCSKNIHQNRQQQFSTILGISIASCLGNYLGLPLIHGRTSRDTFALIIDKVNSRLASWKNKLLNKAGRFCLAKSVLSSLPVYAIQAMWLPDYVCNHMDKMVRRCIWNKGDRDRGWNLVAWSDTCQPKSKGGLGLRSARSNNIALLGKLVDNILHDRDKPWVRVITQRRGILRARNVIAPRYVVYLGDGNSSFWYTNWLGTGRLCNLVPYVHISDSMIKVNDLWNNGTCNMGNLYTLLPHDLFEEINRIIIPIDPQGVDTFRWK